MSRLPRGCERTAYEQVRGDARWSTKQWYLCVLLGGLITAVAGLGHAPSDSLLSNEGERFDRRLLLCFCRLSLRSFLDGLLLCLREEPSRAMSSVEQLLAARPQALMQTYTPIWMLQLQLQMPRSRLLRAPTGLTTPVKRHACASTSRHYRAQVEHFSTALNELDTCTRANRRSAAATQCEHDARSRASGWAACAHTQLLLLPVATADSFGVCVRAGSYQPSSFARLPGCPQLATVQARIAARRQILPQPPRVCSLSCSQP